MAEHCSFFNGPTYSAADFAAYFASFFKNGVFAKPANGLKIRALHNDMRITVLPGVAFIDGYRYELDNSDGEFNLTVPTADGALDRIDIIVVRRDLINQNAKLTYIAGTPASSPTIPPLSRTSDIDDIKLCQIKVAKGAVKISDSNIEDFRFDNSVCGIVASAVTDVSTKELFAQYNAMYQDFQTKVNNAFSTWFANVQNTLSGDTAGNLLQKINAINESKGHANGIAGLNKDGAVPPEQGGTGEKSLSNTRNAMGLGSSGPVPVSAGGTGQNSLAASRSVMGLGNTTGPLPIANGGHGCNNRVDGLHALGINWGTSAAPATAAANSFYIQLL
ncbi:MAG: hypothetical protein LKJ50_03955 [Clostridiales bacterium]|jgi:hypothetical protein|nr:hypothetical protein [Clostridiales bacterium]MCI1961094.1 hypothetical protein [Clostridiales bacterium]MCI2021535.1 hypothetical protein [Clostridiales bacterium]MCI2026321.1 hypothetical protein [Clostridiales bacterium]